MPAPPAPGARAVPCRRRAGASPADAARALPRPTGELRTGPRQFGFQIGDPPVSLCQGVLRLPATAREPLGQLLGAPLGQPHRFGVGAVVTAHEVRQHMDLAEDPHPQLGRDMGVGRERPVAGRDLALVAQLIPQGRERRRADGGPDTAQRAGKALVQQLGNQSGHETGLAGLADQYAVQPVVLGVALEGQLGTADDLPRRARAEAGSDDGAVKSVLQLVQFEAAACRRALGEGDCRKNHIGRHC